MTYFHRQLNISHYVTDSGYKFKYNIVLQLNAPAVLLVWWYNHPSLFLMLRRFNLLARLGCRNKSYSPILLVSWSETSRGYPKTVWILLLKCSNNEICQVLGTNRAGKDKNSWCASFFGSGLELILSLVTIEHRDTFFLEFGPWEHVDLIVKVGAVTGQHRAIPVNLFAYRSSCCFKIKASPYSAH